MLLQPVPLRRRRGVKGASASSGCKGRCIAQTAGGHAGATGAAAGAIRQYFGSRVKFQGTANGWEASTREELHQQDQEQAKQGPGAHYCTEAQATNDGSPPTPQVQVRNPSLPMLVPESVQVRPSARAQCPGPSLLPPLGLGAGALSPQPSQVQPQHTNQPWNTLSYCPSVPSRHRHLFASVRSSSLYFAFAPSLVAFLNSVLLTLFLFLFPFSCSGRLLPSAASIRAHTPILTHAPFPWS